MHTRLLRMEELISQVVVRALPGWTAVEADAVALLVAAEERLLLALEPPAATPAQPLTLAMLQARTFPCRKCFWGARQGA